MGRLCTVQSGLTNASGQVTTMYQAGNNNIQDVIQAALSNGAAAQVVITKTAVGGLIDCLGRSIDRTYRP